MSRVFIPHLPMRPDPILKKNVPTISLTPALEYGRIIVLHEGPQKLNQTDLDAGTEEIQRHTASEEFRSSSDYLMQVGDPILFAYTLFQVTCGHGPSTVQVLSWDRDRSMYNVYQVRV